MMCIYIIVNTKLQVKPNFCAIAYVCPQCVVKEITLAIQNTPFYNCSYELLNTNH